MVGGWVACCLLLGFVHGRERVDPLVETKQGIIRGVRADAGDYSMFLGIPFGKVDENNPFGLATPYPKFEETFLADDESSICPQIEEFNKTIVGSLDCLHLNVYVPNVASSRNKLPVLVWIYGGGFQIGFSGRYLHGPQYLVRHDVIMVTLNYRLGPYGFMCLDTPEVPGNQGLKDQLLGLRWIKDNIESFGGDVNKITLMGESAGAVSVELHLWSQQEKLFNSVILQSGSVYSPWVIIDTDVTQAIRLAGRLGFDTDSTSEAISFLAKTDTRLVIAAASEMSMAFGVCVEKEFDNVESIITEHPRNSNVPMAKNIPILTGFNNKERMVSYLDQPDSYFANLDVFNSSLSAVLEYDEEFHEMAALVRHFYIGDEEFSQDVKWELIDFSSDNSYIYPVHESIDKFLDNGAEKLYHYVFSYSGDRNFVKKRYNITENGAAHADEISFLFDMTYDPSIPTTEDQHIIDVMTTLWTNFVKYGNPTPETTELLPVKWLPVTKDSLNCLNIDTELSLQRNIYHERMSFWKLFFKTNQGKIKGYNPMVPFV
ncbi:carboxyl/choline esterase CCE006a [Danaus plexippus plexippus]|uniref:Carboxylic ester hydrolase n=1 Tax=Danaus plexippus plexippus TaxID=278856 RepID=A0A212FJ60_DANPL|nr:carboxyl/choline esterase CCE006a [Danaus plexippus plexippus]